MKEHDETENLLSTEANKERLLEDVFNDEKRQGVKELIDAHKQEAALKEALLELRKTPMTFEPEQETLEEDEIIEGILHLPNVTRLEVIDDTGRAYVIRNAHVELSYQDDGRTLKIFANPKQ